MHLFLYNIFLLVYKLGIRMAALWNPKAKLWVAGRKGNLSYEAHTVWMHCASLGEFEQGRPLLEAIRKQYPGARILLSFFSPSGYEVRKNYSGVDTVVYLPKDSKNAPPDFLDSVRPTQVGWVK